MKQNFLGNIKQMLDNLNVSFPHSAKLLSDRARRASYAQSLGNVRVRAWNAVKSYVRQPNYAIYSLKLDYR